MSRSEIDGCLSYAIVVNMKVGGTLGEDDSIRVEYAPAVSKTAPAVYFGLLAMDRQTHLDVLAYLQPNWVQCGVGEREKAIEKDRGDGMGKGRKLRNSGRCH